jgi:SnoaL-like domain
MTLLQAIQARDRAALAELLAEDAVFHSPVASYRGRDEVVHLLATIGGVLDDVNVTREVDTVTFVTAQVGDHQLDGMLDEIRDGDGRIAEITLMLRPLAALQAAVERMGRALRAP